MQIGGPQIAVKIGCVFVEIQTAGALVVGVPRFPEENRLESVAPTLRHRLWPSEHSESELPLHQKGIAGIYDTRNVYARAWYVKKHVARSRSAMPE